MREVKWTFDSCRVEALKYKTRNEFKKGSCTAYHKSWKNGWLNIFFTDVVFYWDIEKCANEALNYNTRTEFCKGNKGAYHYAWKNNLLETVCSHMQVNGSLYKRFIYAYEFSDNHVYVGLTFSIISRNYGHLREGSVFDHSKESNLEPTLKQLIDNPVDIDEAMRLENFYLEEYIKNGWLPLNKIKTGGLGGSNKKWTFENIKNEALKYNRRSDFKKGQSTAYTSARENKWLEEVCSHMAAPFEICSKKYTLEQCIELSKSCSSIKEFIKKYKPLYLAIRRNNWKHIVFKDYDEIKLY